MSSIRNIIFDLGGVIITLDQSQAIKRFHNIGIEDIENWLNPYTQKGIFGELEVGKISAEEFRKKLSKIAKRELTFNECKHCWLGYVKDLPKRNIKTLIKLRKEGFHIILLSNTNPYMMDWALSNEFDGEGKSIDKYFDSIYLSYKCKMMKPDERIFKKILDEEQIIANETLYIDDGSLNIEAASKLGFHTYSPANGEDWTDEIEKYL